MIFPQEIIPSLPFEKANTRVLSIDNIFSPDKILTANLPDSEVITLTATGDIIPARSVNYQTVTRQDFNWPYAETSEVLNDSDITMANLESPLIANCPLTQEGMVFCGDPRNVQGLKKAGTDIITLANNHIGNFGISGITNTVDILRKEGILTTGVSKPLITEVKGKRFAFLAYNDIGSPEEGIPWADEKVIQKEVREAKEIADFLVVAFHWGEEYQSQPDKRQRDLAHLAVDLGADLIIGNHPHWIQPVEIYKDKLITYAHGNFIFDQMWSQKTREGVVGRYKIYQDKVVDVEFLPVQIEDFGQPRFVTGSQKASILLNMKTESLKLAGDSIIPLAFHPWGGKLIFA